MKPVSIYFLFLFVAYGSVFSQSDSTQVDTMSYFFDDGRISSSKTYVKLNLLPLINGELAFFLEREFSTSFGVEVGAGVLLPYYVPDVTEIYSVDRIITDPDIGYSIWVNPKYYLGLISPNKASLGLLYRRRNYRQFGENYVFNDFVFNVGFQYLLKARYVIEANVGLGVRSRNYPGQNGFSPGVLSPVGLKLGFIL